MPCYSPVESERDKESVKVLKYLNYCLSEPNANFKQEGRELVEQLNNRRKSSAYFDLEMGNYLDELTRLLCSFLNDNPGFVNNLENLPAIKCTYLIFDLIKWWEEHQEFDRKRLENKN